VEITSQFDDIIQTSGYENLQLIIRVMWISVVVVLIALGKDFWYNIFAMIFFPRVNFGRIAGEQQVLPNMFIALLFGLINGVIGFQYWANTAIQKSYIVYMNEKILPNMTQLEDVLQTDVFGTMVQAMTKDPNYTLGILAMVPIMCLFGWFFYALALFITAKLITKSGGGGLTNYLCGIAPFSWITPLFFLAYWMGFNQDSTTMAMVLNIIGLVLMLFYMIMVMREYYHVAWGKAIFGMVIIAPLTFAVLWIAFIALTLLMIVQINTYI